MDSPSERTAASVCCLPSRFALCNSIMIVDSGTIRIPTSRSPGDSLALVGGLSRFQAIKPCQVKIHSNDHLMLPLKSNYKLGTGIYAENIVSKLGHKQPYNALLALTRL